MGAAPPRSSPGGGHPPGNASPRWPTGRPSSSRAATARKCSRQRPRQDLRPRPHTAADGGGADLRRLHARGEDGPARPVVLQAASSNEETRDGVTRPVPR
ncbi:hypothetical protein QJS66_05700 [Kocuria rhizophila]|nr:hypothetical protein QJS66_05700 [Kocuria rhizophila]